MGFLVVSLISASAYFYFDPENLTPTITDLPTEEITATVSNTDMETSTSSTSTASTSAQVSTTTSSTTTSNN